MLFVFSCPFVIGAAVLAEAKLEYVCTFTYRLLVQLNMITR